MHQTHKAKDFKAKIKVCKNSSFRTLLFHILQGNIPPPHLEAQEK